MDELKVGAKKVAWSTLVPQRMPTTLLEANGS